MFKPEVVLSNNELEKKSDSVSLEKVDTETVPTEVLDIENTEEQDTRDAYELLEKIQSGEIGSQPENAEELYEFGKRYEARKYNLEDLLSVTEEGLLFDKGISVKEMTRDEIEGLIKTLGGSLEELRPSMFDGLPFSKKKVISQLKEKLEIFLQKNAAE